MNTAIRNHVWTARPARSNSSIRTSESGDQRADQERRRREIRGRAGTRRGRRGRGPGKRRERNAAAKASGHATSVSWPACIAGRIAGPRRAAPEPLPARGRPPHTQSSQCSDPFDAPDLVARSTSSSTSGGSARTFARLRAQNAGGPHWSFLDGPITANNPMGVHHAWGRTYKDLFQRFHAMLGEDQRWQNGFDCQGLWVEVNVERDLGLQEQARHRGLRHRRVRVAVQAARPDVRRAPDRAVDPARDVDGLERPRRAAPAARPARRGPRAGDDDPGPEGPDHRHRRDARRAPRACPSSAAATSPSATRTTT